MQREVTINIMDHRFISAPLTMVMIERRKFQQRTNFEPRKGFHMIVKIEEKAK